MPVVTKYICDGCGKEKGRVNHWWMTWQNDHTGIWEVMTFDPSRVYHNLYCGESCAMKALSAWMQERKEQDTETGKG